MAKIPGILQRRDSSVEAEAAPPSFRQVAVHRLLGATGVIVLRDEGRSTPAKVYPAFEGVEHWVVEPPAAGTSAVAEPRTFTGRAALLKALEYAHYVYGNALYLSR